MKKDKWMHISRPFPFIGLLVIVAIFSIISGDKLWTVNNLKSILNTMIPLCLGGAGMIFVAAQGSTDMSVGSTLAFAGTIAALVSVKYGLYSFVLIALIMGILVGLFNGTMLSKFKVPSLMVTLSMLIALRAIVSYITNGQAVFVDPQILKLNQLQVKLPIFIITIGVMWYLFEYTKIGFFSKCIGENQVVAQFSGVPIKKYKILAFALSGIMAGLVGIFTVGNIGGVSPNMGNFFELQVMTAMFVGGVPVAGGTESRFYKVIVGSLMLAFLQNGLTITRVSAEMSELIQGVILLCVVFFNLVAREKFIKLQAKKEV